ncbi:hypothetical protein K2Q16_03555 [Patescibacteria group bacterium]|nr:hypothetical protein [Patescibacteria group bacterium]
MKNHFAPRGFIALLTMIIISSVLLVTTLSLAQFGLTHRYFILDLEHKSVSTHLAEACVHIARVLIMNSQSDSLTFPHPFPVHQEFCTIHLITRAGTTSAVETEGTHEGISTHYSVTVDNNNGSFLSWEEIINP